MATVTSTKKKSDKVYFTEDTEKAIIAYNKSTDSDEREQIFRSKIQGPLDKLAENVINRFKFPYMEGTFDEIKAQVVSFLVINLHKFTEDKGKAFSYFSVIAKNYLILHNNNSYKEEKRVLYFSDQTEESFTLEEMLIVEPETRDSTVDMKEFLRLLVDYWEFNTTKIFKKKRDIEIASAIVKLIERIDNIDNFNKKALYLMVREMTNYKTAHITKVINKMRPHIIRMLGDIFSEIHKNTDSKRAQINSFIMKMVQLIRTPEDAAVIGPIVQGFLEVNVKNDEHLVRVAQIAQRIVSVGVKSNASLDGLLSEEEKNALLKDINVEIQGLQEDVKDLDDVFAEKS